MLPAEMGKRLIRFRHFMRIVPFLYGRTFCLIGRYELICKFIYHTLSLTGAGKISYPAQGY